MQPNEQLPNNPQNPQQQTSPVLTGVPPMAQQPPVDGANPPQTTQEPKKGDTSTAQGSLLFSEMREGMIIMQDSSFRAVVECDSINFDLMSSREREGVEYSYQNFINSLYFPVQILIRSRRVDIAPYLDRLMTIRRSQDNMLLTRLMDDYMDFIEILSQEANIMDKRFYVVVPFFPGGDVAEISKQAKGLFDSFFSGSSKKIEVTKINQVDYEKAKDEIKNRVDTVMGGLFQMGIQSRHLSTEQLSILFYNSYNPDTSPQQPLGDVPMADMTTLYVKKGDNTQSGVV